MRYCGGNLNETSQCARLPLTMTDCGLLQNETSDSTRIPSSMSSLNELNRHTRQVFWPNFDNFITTKFFNVQQPFSHVICAFLSDIQKGILGATGRFEAVINSCTKVFK